MNLNIHVPNHFINEDDLLKFDLFSNTETISKNTKTKENFSFCDKKLSYKLIELMQEFKIKMVNS